MFTSKEKLLKTSKGEEVRIAPKLFNTGSAVEVRADGKLIQYRTDVDRRGSVEETLRQIWIGLFGREEAESLLTQFKERS